MSTDKLYVVIKRGLFWRPEDKGYTAKIEEAGRYTKEEAESRCHGGEQPVTMALASSFQKQESLQAEVDSLRAAREQDRLYIKRLLTPTPTTDEIRDKFRGDETGLCRALISHANQQERRLAVADAALAEAREEPADLKLVREGCKEVAADVIKAVERRYGDGFGVPANLKTEITTIIAANLWTGHTDAERFVSEQAIADLTTRCASLISSLEKICASNIDMTFMRDIANAALAAALHPATKEGKA